MIFNDVLTHEDAVERLQKKYTMGVDATSLYEASFYWQNLTASTPHIVYLVGSSENPDKFYSDWTEVLKVEFATTGEVVVAVESGVMLGIGGLLLTACALVQYLL